VLSECLQSIDDAQRGDSVDAQAVNLRDGHNVQAVNRPICPICLASESINL